MPERPVNIPEWAKWFGLQTFDEPQLEEMVRVSANFMMELKARKPVSGLVLLGTSGAGKSHIARRIRKWWAQTGQWYEAGGANLVMPGHYCFWPNFLTECRNRDFSRTEDLCEDAFVILDDIGAGTDTTEPKGWIVDLLTRIMENRINAETDSLSVAPIKRATIITANLSMEQFGDFYDQRLASRLMRMGNNLIEVDVPDYALREKSQ